jgi:chemotaxis signal transduction protein
LLRQKETAAPHGIVLKHQPPDAPKTTLLTPKIDAELEIPEEEIRGLPEVLGGSYKNFRGAYCGGQKVILILNPEKLLEGAHD